MSQITLHENGNVSVSRDFFDHESMATITEITTYTLHGNAVHRIWPNGTTSEAYEGLRPSGYFLRCNDGDLVGAIRRTMAN